MEKDPKLMIQHAKDIQEHKKGQSLNSKQKMGFKEKGVQIKTKQLLCEAPVK